MAVRRLRLASTKRASRPSRQSRERLSGLIADGAMAAIMLALLVGIAVHWLTAAPTR